MLEDSVREARIKKILQTLKLNPKHLQYIKKINPSTTLPYHGYQHLFTTAIACYDAAEFYCYKNNKTVRNLVLAGLYHGWGHSDKYNNNINAAQAVTGMIKSMNKLEPNFENNDVEEIASLIVSTKSPNDHTSGSLEEKIISDATLLQWVEPDFHQWEKALSKELHIPVTYESTCSFLSTHTIYTSWARTLFVNQGLLKRVW